MNKRTLYKNLIDRVGHVNQEVTEILEDVLKNLPELDGQQPVRELKKCKISTDLILAIFKDEIKIRR